MLVVDFIGVTVNLVHVQSSVYTLHCIIDKKIDI
jgi:hypothetical protein